MYLLIFQIILSPLGASGSIKLKGILKAIVKTSSKVSALNIALGVKELEVMRLPQRFLVKIL